MGVGGVSTAVAAASTDSRQSSGEICTQSGLKRQEDAITVCILQDN